MALEVYCRLSHLYTMLHLRDPVQRISRAIAWLRDQGLFAGVPKIIFGDHGMHEFPLQAWAEHEHCSLNYQPRSRSNALVLNVRACLRCSAEC